MTSTQWEQQERRLSPSLLPVATGESLQIVVPLENERYSWIAMRGALDGLDCVRGCGFRGVHLAKESIRGEAEHKCNDQVTPRRAARIPRRFFQRPGNPSSAHPRRMCSECTALFMQIDGFT